ncbi:unnamed protein product [Euphydryas editha]|uniref:Uncharacterized protein n=1 Tax=Euphydryas editha TaxID=104508 RepID=A0AAU9UXT3_EUPED|nr:unnamed protein product [Euphydryas editha]
MIKEPRGGCAGVVTRSASSSRPAALEQRPRARARAGAGGEGARERCAGAARTPATPAPALTSRTVPDR